MIKLSSVVCCLSVSVCKEFLRCLSVSVCKEFLPKCKQKYICTYMHKMV